MMADDPICTCGHPRSLHEDPTPQGLGCDGEAVALVLKTGDPMDGGWKRPTWCHCEAFHEATTGQVQEWVDDASVPVEAE